MRIFSLLLRDRATLLPVVTDEHAPTVKDLLWGLELINLRDLTIPMVD